MVDWRDEKTEDGPLVQPREATVKPPAELPKQPVDEEDPHDGWQPVRRRSSRPPDGG